MYDDRTANASIRWHRVNLTMTMHMRSVLPQIRTRFCASSKRHKHTSHRGTMCGLNELTWQRQVRAAQKPNALARESERDAATRVQEHMQRMQQRGIIRRKNMHIMSTHHSIHYVHKCTLSNLSCTRAHGSRGTTCTIHVLRWRRRVALELGGNAQARAPEIPFFCERTRSPHAQRVARVYDANLQKKRCIFRCGTSTRVCFTRWQLKRNALKSNV